MAIIGITGLMGSGTDTAANYITKKYRYKLLHMSDIMRDMARKEGYELTRDGLQAFRKKHGNTFIAEEIARRIKKGQHKNIVVAAIRRSEDFLIPKKHFRDMKLIVIYTEEKIRFQRLKRRQRLSDPKNMEEFKRQQDNEFKIYDFDKTFSFADYVIENNFTEKELHKNIDRVMKAITK